MKYLNIRSSTFIILWSSFFFGKTLSQEAPDDPCIPNPCQNVGVCEKSESTFRCRCRRPYSGRTCEEGPCQPNPCLNSGTCEQSGETFTCKCLGTFTGLRCETETTRSACIPNPCENESDCRDEEKSPLCTCTGGYAGLYCQSDDLLPVVAEVGEDIDVACMNAQNISTIGMEVTNIDEQRKHRTSNNSIRIERVEIPDIDSTLLCHYMWENTSSTTSTSLPLIVVETRKESLDSFTELTCTAVTKINDVIVTITSDNVKREFKRDTNGTDLDSQDTNFTKAEENKTYPAENTTLERNGFANETGAENETAEDVAQKESVNSKSIRIENNNVNVWCTIAFNGKRIWSGKLSEKKEVRRKANGYEGFPVWAWVLLGLVIVGGVTAIVLFNIYVWKRSKTKRYNTRVKPDGKEEEVELDVPLKSQLQETHE